MSALCPNCKARLSCGCQKRTASNGATVCANCLISYEQSLKKPKATNNMAPTNVTVSAQLGQM